MDIQTSHTDSVSGDGEKAATTDHQKIKTDVSGDGVQHEELQGPEALQEILKQITELKEYGLYYLTAKTDAVKAVSQKLVLVTIGGILALGAVSGLLVVSVVLFCMGIANGLGELLGRAWLGDLVAALLFLSLVIITTIVTVKKYQKTSLKRTVQTYEQRQNRQRQKFGHSVSEQARAAAGRTIATSPESSL